VNWWAACRPTYRGSTKIAWLFCLLPGLCYALYRQFNKVPHCSVCHAASPVSLKTPRGKALSTDDTPKPSL